MRHRNVNGVIAEQRNQYANGPNGAVAELKVRRQYAKGVLAEHGVRHEYVNRVIAEQ